MCSSYSDPVENLYRFPGLSETFTGSTILSKSCATSNKPQNANQDVQGHAVRRPGMMSEIPQTLCEALPLKRSGSKPKRAPKKGTITHSLMPKKNIYDLKCLFSILTLCFCLMKNCSLSCGARLLRADGLYGVSSK
jgi:hypothetical protein